MGVVFNISQLNNDVYNSLNNNNFSQYATPVTNGNDLSVLYYASANRVLCAAYPSDVVGYIGFMFHTIDANADIKQWWIFSDIIEWDIETVLEGRAGYFCEINSDNIPLDNSLYEPFQTKLDAVNALAAYEEYPINYTLANCTVSAPSTASPGSDVVIQITPSSGYIFRGASGVDIRDSDGTRVPFIVNGNQVAFTMPQP